jgi:hypothetical protein
MSTNNEATNKREDERQRRRDQLLKEIESALDAFHDDQNDEIGALEDEIQRLERKKKRKKKATKERERMRFVGKSCSQSSHQTCHTEQR